jgi:hypothetical protein
MEVSTTKSAELLNLLVAEVNHNVMILHAGMEDKPTVMLGTPQMLTVKLQNGDYRKESHIGLEEFYIKAIRKGRKDLIIEYEPTFKARYSHAEMELSKSWAEFKRLDDVLSGLVAGADWSWRMMQIEKAVADEGEAKKAVMSFKTYDKFGTF